MKARIENCIQCEKPFEISPREQERCELAGFDLPRRCPDCRRHKKRPENDIPRRQSKDKKKHYYIKNNGYDEDFD